MVYRLWFIVIVNVIGVSLPSFIVWKILHSYKNSAFNV